MIKSQKLLPLLLALLLFTQMSLGSLILTQEIAQAETTESYSLGQVIDEWEKMIAPGAEQETMTIESTRGRQEVFIMNVDPSQENLSLETGLPNGKDFGMQPVRKQAEAVSQPGNIVIGGFNGDFYNMSTGIPNGTVIQDGRILKSSNNETIGIKKDGSAIIGVPNVQIDLQVNGTNREINHINGSRETNQLVLFSAPLKTTGTNSSGTEAVLTNVEGDVHKPGIVKAKVEKTIAGEGNQAIEEGKLVISGHGASSDFVKSLTSGQELEITTTIDAKWQDVVEGISGNYTLVKSGQKVDLPSNSFTTAVAPRTAVGIRADGSIFFVVLDGRQPGYSEGTTVFELRDMMYELGAVDALNLDGGGSSTFAVRQPGNQGLSVVNQPSDGNERPVANSLLVTTSAEPSALSQLAVEPDHLLMLAGSREDLNAKGMDKNYFPKELTTEPNWSVSDEKLGSVNAEGLFTAGNTAMKASAVADANGSKGESVITVTDKLSELKFPQDSLTVKRGSEVNLAPTALLNGKKVDADPHLFEWQVSGNIGEIDDNGKFKAGNQTGNGTITVKYGEVTDTIEIQVGKMPIILEDFEENFQNWTYSGARYKSISIRQTTYPEPARFDNHSLQLNYDFSGTIGTSGAYAHRKQPIEIEDYPEAIGMWVYGDGKGHWLRAQMRDGNGSAFPIDFAAKMDWTGWKYVEAALPAGKDLPLKMDLPIRLMETNNNNKNAGTIYVDNIRAVYGETNDDLINPAITGEQPADQAEVSESKPVISAVAKDEETGINSSRISLLVDGKKVEHKYEDKTGSVTYQPKTDLLDGHHIATLVVQDNFGNETIKTWMFKTKAGQPGIMLSTPEKAYVGGDFPIALNATKLKEIDNLKLKLKVNPANLKPEQDKVDFSKQITNEMIVKNQISQDGTIEIELKGLNSIETKEEAVLGNVPFTIPVSGKGEAILEFKEGLIKLAGSHEKSSIFLPDIKKEIQAHYQMTVDRVSQGFPSTLSVKDENGKPADRAKIQVVSPKYELGKVIAKQTTIYKESNSTSETVTSLKKNAHLLVVKKEQDWLEIKLGTSVGWVRASDIEVTDWSLGITDRSGKLKTEKLTLIPGDVSIQASREKKYSHVIDLNVLKHLGSNIPERQTVTFDDKKDVRNINWTTSPLTTKSIVEILRTEDYKRNGFSGRKIKTVKGDSNPHPMNEGEIQSHTVRVTKLKPGESYTYRVGDGTDEGWSEPASLVMNEKGKDEPFHFVLMGDTQAPPNQTEAGFGIFTELFKKSKQEYPNAAFMMHVGDMIDDGNLYSHWSAFFEAMKDPALGASTLFVPAVGNHENIGNGVDTYKNLFRMPQNGPDGYEGTVYSYDYGNAHFAVLNTETDKKGLEKQAAWLKKDMKKTKKKWKIVLYHRSPYYSNPQGGSESVREAWPKVFDEIGVDLAISGHDHAYVRTFPLKDGKKANGGTTYLIAGSTGSKFYDAVPQDYMDVYFEEKTQVYSNISVSDDGIKIVAKARDGRVIDEHMITKEEEKTHSK
ncbi:phosphodiester glycosidase family protein [Metabacillus arenae]|uniref:Phosphodiester glycosidase family protein n=1 Tax=Metabacillus arenae TaxID=2771434 RepID=A0A926RVX9_9BACI|nr:phosphodiester glycosidase family protein [Metabacillus arenae]MBD1379366.1 phosphodiester glycosidase family protein [Metabacillus arenae]